MPTSSIKENVSYFLRHMLKDEETSTVKALANKCHISNTSAHKLLHKQQPRPSLESIHNIANAYQISIKDLIEQTTTEQKSINCLPYSIVIRHLKSFITNKLTETKENPAKLACQLGFSEGAIKEFISIPPKKESLGIQILNSLSEHWHISIDEMLGRTGPEIPKDLQISSQGIKKQQAGLNSIKRQIATSSIGEDLESKLPQEALIKLERIRDLTKSYKTSANYRKRPINSTNNKIKQPEHSR